MTSRRRGDAGTGAPTVLLASTVGGHLTELRAIVERAALPGERLWMTWRNAQTEALLAGEAVVWVGSVQPRDWRGVVRTARATWRILRQREVAAVVSTGSGIALGVLPIAALRRVPCHFVESATHVSGRGVTGRLLGWVPGIRLYTQHPRLAGGRWRHRGSVFEGFGATATAPAPAPAPATDAAAPDAPDAASARPWKVVVTLGTMEHHEFRRLLERLVELLPSDADVLWQTGCTRTDGLPIAATPMVAPEVLHAAIAEADLVVGHCGVGTALAALEAGRFPVLVPRDAAHGENVDDHQHDLAAELTRLGLASTPTLAELDAAVLRQAVGRRVERLASPPPFRLDGVGTAAARPAVRRGAGRVPRAGRHANV